MLRFLALAVTMFTLTNCRTVQVWDKGYPKPSEELKTEEDKTKEFNKFAIAEGNVSYGNEGFVQTQADKK
ncbi:MAG: hypothetical protein R3B45_18225 [Bdellovibrionota bacterium]